MKIPESFNLSFSSQTISRIIMILFPIILGSGYGAVVFIEKMNKTIAATAKFKVIEDQIYELELSLKSIKERQMESLESNIRLQEKASEAIALSRESNALAKSTQRELQATTDAVRSEVETMIKATNEKLEVIKRATTNPLDRR